MGRRLILAISLFSMTRKLHEPEAADPWPPEFMEQFLVRSPTVREIRLSHPLEFILETQSPEFLEVAVGCDVGIADDVHRFDRWATLRLYRSGVIAKLLYGDLEDRWDIEYRP